MGRMIGMPVMGAARDVKKVLLTGSDGKTVEFLPQPVKPRVYLAGGIDILDGKCVDSWSRWRDWVVADLREKFELVDPKDHGVMQNAFEVVQKDLDAINSCDVVLMEYMDPYRQYEGTMMELAYAYALGKPVIVFSKHVYAEPVRKHPWIRHHAKAVFPSYLAAVTHILKEYV